MVGVAGWEKGGVSLNFGRWVPGNESEAGKHAARHDDLT